MLEPLSSLSERQKGRHGCVVLWRVEDVGTWMVAACFERRISFGAWKYTHGELRGLGGAPWPARARCWTTCACGAAVTMASPPEMTCCDLLTIRGVCRRRLGVDEAAVCSTSWRRAECAEVVLSMAWSRAVLYGEHAIGGSHDVAGDVWKSRDAVDAARYANIVVRDREHLPPLEQVPALRGARGRGGGSRRRASSSSTTRRSAGCCSWSRSLRDVVWALRGGHSTGSCQLGSFFERSRVFAGECGCASSRATGRSSIRCRGRPTTAEAPWTSPKVASAVRRPAQYGSCCSIRGAPSLRLERVVEDLAPRLRRRRRVDVAHWPRPRRLLDDQGLSQGRAPPCDVLLAVPGRTGRRSSRATPRSTTRSASFGVRKLGVP